MDVRGLLTEGFGRITELYAGITDDLDDETLHHRPGGTGNPVGWLLWHLARVQDDHVADLAGQPQVWERFQDRFGLPNGTGDIGYGHTSEQVDAVRIEDPALLAEYHHEVTLATARYLQTVDEVSSWQYSAEDSTIAQQLDEGLRKAGVRLDDDERTRILAEIDDMKDESSSAPQVRSAAPVE